MKPLEFNPTGMTDEQWSNAVREHNLIKEIMYLRACNRKLIKNLDLSEIPEIDYSDFRKEFILENEKANEEKFLKCRW